jgi:hypothetical protein
MRQFFTRAILGSSLLLGGLTIANAQYQPRWQYQVQENNRGHDYILNQVRADLNRAESSAFPFTGDRYRLNRAEEAMNQFQRTLGSGDYARAELNQAIMSVRQVLDRSRLPQQTRDMLWDDIGRMQDLRRRLDREWYQ